MSAKEQWDVVWINMDIVTGNLVKRDCYRKMIWKSERSLLTVYWKRYQSIFGQRVLVSISTVSHSRIKPTLLTRHDQLLPRHGVNCKKVCQEQLKGKRKGAVAYSLWKRCYKLWTVIWNTYRWVVCRTCSPVFSSDIREQFKSPWEIIFAGRRPPSEFSGCTFCYEWCRVQNVSHTSPLPGYQPNWKYLSLGTKAIIIECYWTKHH